MTWSRWQERRCLMDKLRVFAEHTRPKVVQSDLAVHYLCKAVLMLLEDEHARDPWVPPEAR